MFDFKKHQKKNDEEKDKQHPSKDTKALKSVMSEGKLRMEMDNACRSLQYVDLTNSMQLKSGILNFDKTIQRPSIINKKDNPNEERFNYTSTIPNISTKATYRN